ncbi:aspartate kinase [Aneurinibacillus aneurinilyticus]|uniref:Aspartokinase n=1 Tax=Aneurinibacillus aneurinilyticus TaxID=1391 RepID=A0A848CSH0_ANEAE|nr:aspartate kinase [Aneurinibacillus aneurinilyticus]MED0669378.1 aspartate kinase [Aneurinibacillus aneurinilyticus]NME97289.1 aspartate kinase [Aneurinibacillus aneurinilyticus]
MRILVQKFGGSSLTTAEKRERAAHHIVKALEQGYSVCVVVSAMGRKGDPYATDTLLDLIRENGDALGKREKDMLMSCGEVISAATMASMLNAKGFTTAVLTGGQAGILTNDDYTNAQIATINPQRIVRELEQGKIVIVTGFQGRTTEWDTTTLGRGGSDTSATALGVALQAEMVDIFTDVNGIMTADPRIVEEARSLSTITYTEICNMAYQGAKVLHPRAVEIAMQTNTPIRVRSTFSDDGGTLVTSVAEANRVAGEVNDRLITGIAHVSNVTQIKVMAKEGEYDLQMQVFKAMAENEISVDFINVNPLGVAYTVHDEVVEKAVNILHIMGYEPLLTQHCAKVSIIGAGMAGVPGVMARIVETLTKEDIQILQSADSHTTIWVLVKEVDMVRAVRALHKTFDLDKVQF